MDNFEDMSLEELQQLLQINKKDPEQVKRVQQLSGLTGKAVDGLWGKQTEKAWNNYMDSNQNEIEDNIREIQAHQNAMERGQINPQVVDVLGYSNQLDEQKKARDAKIAELESQIAMVKERIVRNERALTGKSYEDANNQIAALEMRKINSSDPTTLWRWQQQRQDTKEANANTKAKAVEQFKNKVNMWNRTKPSNTPEGLEQQISNINAAILEGDNIGADVSELYVKLQDLQNRLPASENTQADVDTLIKTAKTSDEIASFLNTHSNLRPEQRTILKVRLDELQKKEKANAYEREFIAWVEKKTGKKASSLSDRTLKTYRNVWKNMRGR